MWVFLFALSFLAWLPVLPALRPPSLFSRQGSNGKQGQSCHLLSETSSSSSWSSTSSDNTRPGGWRQVLSFGNRGGAAASTLHATRRTRRQYYYSSDLYYLSAVPTNTAASMKNETNDITSNSKASAAMLRQEAAEWRKRAQELKSQVQSMEAELQQSRSTWQQKRQADTADLIARMFFANRPLTPEACAQIMREEKWTAEEAQMVLDELFAQAHPTNVVVGGNDTGDAKDATPTSTTNPTTASTSTNDDTNNPQSTAVPTFNATESLLLEAKMDCLIHAAEILDEISMASKDSVRRWSGRVGSVLRARRNELRRAHDQTLARQMVAVVNASIVDKNVYSGMGGGLMMEGQGQFPSQSTATNASSPSPEQQLLQLSMVPLWLPSTLFEFLVASPSEVLAEDVKTFKEKVLSGTAFFCTSSESMLKAAIFRGNIRGVRTTDRNVTAAVLHDIQQRLHEYGLAERLQIFLMPDPEWKPNRDQSVAQEPPKPVILAIPADVVPDAARLPGKKSLTRKTFKATAALLPLLTTSFYSITCYSLNPNFFHAVMKRRNPPFLSTCWPVISGVFLVQAIHELAHFLVAKKRGIKIGLPFPLPSFQLGMFGCITPLRSFPKDRSALLDFALSGPVSAMLASIGMMIAGIHLTVRASVSDILRFPMLPIEVLKSSFLTGTLLTLLAPKSMILPRSQPLPLHPLFFAGFAGSLTSAVNMLPAFRLDGGRACSAAMGSRFCAVTSSGTLVFLFSLALSSSTGVALSLGMLILLFQRRFDIPVRDELTDVDDVRLAGWIGSLATAMLALTPFPGGSCIM